MRIVCVCVCNCSDRTEQTICTWTILARTEADHRRDVQRQEKYPDLVKTQTHSARNSAGILRARISCDRLKNRKWNCSNTLSEKEREIAKRSIRDRACLFNCAAIYSICTIVVVYVSDCCRCRLSNRFSCHFLYKYDLSKCRATTKMCLQNGDKVILSHKMPCFIINRENRFNRVIRMYINSNTYSMYTKVNILHLYFQFFCL